MRQLLLHTLVADVTDTESNYLLASLLGATDSIDVLKPDGARLNLKKRPGEIVRDSSGELLRQSSFSFKMPRDALENDAVIGQPGDVFRSSGFSTACCATSGLRVPARPVGAEVVLELILRMNRSAMFATAVPPSPRLLVRGGLRSVAAGRVLARGTRTRRA